MSSIKIEVEFRDAEEANVARLWVNASILEALAVNPKAEITGLTVLARALEHVPVPERSQ